VSNTNYWDEIEQAFDEVDIYETYEVFQRGAAKYPEWQIDLLAVHWTMSEICNGGLAQYFSNSTAILAPEAVLGLQRLRKPELAAALQKAMALLGEPYPRERDKRAQRLEAVTGSKSDGGESFSMIPNWVAKKTGLSPSESPFDEMDELLSSASDELEQTMNQYAGSKVS
jgi:hypothetical protein